jgi:hypothetical protein
MSPDRVIVGEVRGDEILPMLLAMSQGNDGSLCTIHASTSKETFKRFQMYAAMSPERLDATTTNLLVANAVHLIVHIGWVDGCRRVTSVREVVDVDGPRLVSNEVWQPAGERPPVESRPRGGEPPSHVCEEPGKRRRLLLQRERMQHDGFDDASPREAWRRKVLVCLEVTCWMYRLAGPCRSLRAPIAGSQLPRGSLHGP